MYELNIPFEFISSPCRGGPGGYTGTIAKRIVCPSVGKKWLLAVLILGMLIPGNQALAQKQVPDHELRLDVPRVPWRPSRAKISPGQPRQPASLRTYAAHRPCEDHCAQKAPAPPFLCGKWRPRPFPPCLTPRRGQSDAIRDSGYRTITPRKPCTATGWKRTNGVDDAWWPIPAPAIIRQALPWT